MDEAIERATGHPFQTMDVVYYCAVYLLGFLAGVFQTLRDRDFVSCRNALNVGLVSGFLAFAVVSLIDGDRSEYLDNPFLYLGIAALIGLSVKWQDQIIKAAWEGIAPRFGIAVETGDAPACVPPGNDDDEEPP